MKHIFCRVAKTEEVPLFIEYETSTANNLFDPSVVGYKTTTTWVAFDKTGPIVFCPVQRPFFMEALGIKPGLSEIDTAVALKEITQALVTQAHLEDRGEIYFLCSDESTIEYAKRQCFEEMPWKVLRIKLSDLEPKP